MPITSPLVRNNDHRTHPLQRCRIIRDLRVGGIRNHATQYFTRTASLWLEMLRFLRGRSDFGRVGDVGTVDVEVQTGEMDNSPKRKAEIEHCAMKLAARLPPYQPLQTIPEQSIPKHLSPVSTLILPEDELLPETA